MTDSPSIACVMTLPRAGFSIAQWSIYHSLAENGLAVAPTYGVYYHKCMEWGFEQAVMNRADWILTIDGDSMIRPSDVRNMLAMFATDPADALCARQAKRGGERVLKSHFGLTLIKVANVAILPKPWFLSVPSDSNDWHAGAIEADVNFFRKWHEAGNTVGTLEQCRIGHLEEMVRIVNENGAQELVACQTWLNTPEVKQ